MTWWSEHSAVPRLVLAKLAIRCRFVDRFVGSRVPSRVSGQRFSPRGASLPSVGSRRARFPVFIGNTKALRLPARANLLPYGFGCRPHAPLLCSCIAEALLTGLEEARQAWNTWSAGVPCPACRTRGRVRDLTGFLATHPMPLPCSKTPAEPTKPRLSRSCRHRPRPTQTEGLSLYIISRLTQGFSIRCLRFTSDVAAAHARLASGWRAAPLPGGGRTLWIASKGFRLHPILLSRTSPVARVVYAKRPFAGPAQVLDYVGALYPPRRHLQQPPAVHGRRQGPLPLEGLPGRQPAEDHDPRRPASSSAASCSTCCPTGSTASATSASSATAIVRGS